MGVVITPIPFPTPPPSDAVCDADPLDLLDIECDWRVYDGFQQVTFWRRLPVPAGTTVHNALFIETDDHEAQTSFGVYTRHTGTFFLPKEQMPSVVKVGDYIQDALSNYWVIINVDSPGIGNGQWQLFVNSLRFNLPLTDVINYYSVNTSVDAYGGRVLNKNLINEALICVIQPIASDDEIKANRLYHNTTHFIYLEDDIDVRIGNVVEDINNNKWYKIDGVEHKKRIDEFNRLIVRELIHPDEIE